MAAQVRHNNIESLRERGNIARENCTRSCESVKLQLRFSASAKRRVVTCVRVLVEGTMVTRRSSSVG
jgi:hypothetical protein